MKKISCLKFCIKKINHVLRVTLKSVLFSEANKKVLIFNYRIIRLKNKKVSENAFKGIPLKKHKFLKKLFFQKYKNLYQKQKPKNKKLPRITP